MSEEQAPYTNEATSWDCDRSVSLALSTVLWKAEHRGHRYIVWFDPEEADVDNLFIAATDPRGEDKDQHTYPSLPAAKAACERHHATGKWD